MIHVLDNILADLIQSRVGTLSGVTQVGFEPPNEEWRTAIVANSEERLNLYLFDLRENLKLRSNEFTRRQQNGWYSDRHDLPRLDCQYLITLWSPATAMLPVVEPTRDEHELLYEVARVLLQNRSVVVANVYQQGLAFHRYMNLSQVPPDMQDQELPIAVGLPDTMRDLGEFWSAMQGMWRPALHLTVTIPVFPLTPDKESPMVTAAIGDYRQRERSTSAEVWLTIGGQVTKSGSGEAAKGVYVRIQGLNPVEVQIVNRHVITKADGRFLFERLRAGEYELHAVAPSLGQKSRIVNLPSETGEYDLQI